MRRCFLRGVVLQLLHHHGIMHIIIVPYIREMPLHSF